MNAIVTPAQRAVLAELVRDGADNATIARRLGVTVDTVKTHLKRALATTDLANRTELAVAILRGHVTFTVANRQYRADNQPASDVA